MSNGFLEQFIKMRQKLNNPPAPVGKIPTKAVMSNHITYKRIIEEKPKDSDVLKWLKHRIDEIVDEEEAEEAAKPKRR